MADIGNVLGDFDVLAGLAFDRVRYGQRPVEHSTWSPRWSRYPNPDSRVLLGDETDALGLRRVKLDWRLTEFDHRSVRRGLEVLAEEIGRLEIGRMKILLSEDGTTWPDDLEGANHRRRDPHARRPAPRRRRSQLQGARKRQSLHRR